MSKNKGANRILVISLGGTVCSRVTSDNTIKLAAPPDKSFWDSMKFGGELVFVNPISYSSENAGISYFRTAIKGIYNACEEYSPDGILILHGTDSMAYFAQLSVRVLSFLDLPVVITGSKKPLRESGSDGAKNIRYSLNLLNAACDSGSGSATFGIVYSDSFMGDTVFVAGNLVTDADYYGDYRKSGARGKFTAFSRDEAIAFMESEKVPAVLPISNAPGFPYGAVDLDKVDAVLVEAYHSGTANSISGENGLPEFIRTAVTKGIPCYLAPVPKHDKPYESELILKEAGIIPVKELCFEGAWAEVVLKTLLK